MSKKISRFKPGKSACPEKQWRPGQSGNPLGVSRLRAQYEQTFLRALYEGGTPEEARDLLWAAMRKSEAWAISLFWSKVAPANVRLELGSDVKNEFDFTRISDDELKALEGILERVARPVALLENGDVPAPSPDVC
jgi:hypothetical protein